MSQHFFDGGGTKETRAGCGCKSSALGGGGGAGEKRAWYASSNIRREHGGCTATGVVSKGVHSALGPAGLKKGNMRGGAGGKKVKIAGPAPLY